ncbi:G-protein coupled receptor activity protein, partial [Halocaridina rubra]
MWLGSQTALSNLTEDITVTSLEMNYTETSLKNDCDYKFNISLNESLHNATCLEQAPQFTVESMIRGSVLSIMAILSLIGNTATIISIARQRSRLNSTVYILIRHLSIADLFVTFACTVTEAVWTYTVQWYGGNVLCKLMKYLQMFSLHLSTFILVLIGMDRYYAVKYPMRRSDIRKYIGYGIIFIWTLSGIFSIPQAVVFHVLKGPFTEEFYQCVTYGTYSAHWQEHLYMSFGLTCMFILPLVILTATYVSTFITLK